MCITCRAFCLYKDTTQGKKVETGKNPSPHFPPRFFFFFGLFFPKFGSQYLSVFSLLRSVVSTAIHKAKRPCLGFKFSPFPFFLTFPNKRAEELLLGSSWAENFLEFKVMEKPTSRWVPPCAHPSTTNECVIKHA